MQGTVRRFNNAKGFGFIGRDDREADVFVHYTAILGEGYRALNEGDPVEFGNSRLSKVPKDRKQRTSR
jgi:CspA family cold shock protein